ncbi:MAG: rRNA maturation RNase YbeY [Patescibacteria group bacterium]
MTLLIRNFTKNRVGAKRLETVAQAVLAEEKIKGEVEVSLVFTGEKRIRSLNRLYRGVDRVTDVLSFEGENNDGFVSPEDGVSYLGEIFICHSRAQKQAREKKHSIEKEIDILLVHGLFHLLGYDHIKDEDYAVMHKKEEKILKKIYR